MLRVKVLERAADDRVLLTEQLARRVARQRHSHAGFGHTHGIGFSVGVLLVDCHQSAVRRGPVAHAFVLVFGARLELVLGELTGVLDFGQRPQSRHMVGTDAGQTPPVVGQYDAGDRIVMPFELADRITALDISQGERSVRA